MSSPIRTTTGVFLAAVFLQLAVFGSRGDLIGGWALNAQELHVGFARLLFPFFAGVLLNHVGASIRVKGAFGVSSLLLLVSLSLPRFGGTQHPLDEWHLRSALRHPSLSGHCGDRRRGKRVDGLSIRTARFFGDLSYPLYITHYPWVYIYTAWVIRVRPTGAQGVFAALLVAVVAIAVAHASLKLYDEPVRRWLSRKFLAKQG